jgi:hypothetical protein
MATQNIPWNNLYLLNSQDYSIVWTMKGPFSSDLMAGLISAGVMLLSEYEGFNQTDSGYIFGGSYGNNLNDIIDLYDITSIGPDYLYYSDIYENETNELPSPGKIGLWIFNKDSTTGITWDLIEVSNIDEFMQGFITMSNAFGVDFRDFILRPPIDSNGIEYDSPTYNIKEYLSNR